jgi:hypothetical protein
MTKQICYLAFHIMNQKKQTTSSSRDLRKCTLKKFWSDSKEKKQASNLDVLVDFKRKIQDCQVFDSYHESKLFGVGSHDHTVFGPHIPFFGFVGLFSP